MEIEEQSDLRRFMMQVKVLRERVQNFEKECQRNFDLQREMFEELLRWCDYMLYISSELYCKSPKKEETAPEDP